MKILSILAFIFFHQYGFSCVDDGNRGGGMYYPKENGQNEVYILGAKRVVHKMILKDFNGEYGGMFESVYACDFDSKQEPLSGHRLVTLKYIESWVTITSKQLLKDRAHLVKCKPNLTLNIKSKCEYRGYLQSREDAVYSIKETKDGVSLRGMNTSSVELMECGRIPRLLVA
jgi:hypothetical protein